MELLRIGPCRAVAIGAQVPHDETHVLERLDSCAGCPEPEALRMAPDQGPCSIDEIRRSCRRLRNRQVNVTVCHASAYIVENCRRT